jgi:hypothetical protein
MVAAVQPSARPLGTNALSGVRKGFRVLGPKPSTQCAIWCGGRVRGFRPQTLDPVSSQHASPTNTPPLGHTH